MKWLLRNISLLFLALILSLAVWVSAVTSADPDEVRDYPHPVQLEIIGQDPRLVIVGTVPSQVSISLRAPRSVWNSLNSSDGQVRAILDLSGLQTGDHSLSIQPQVKIQPVRVMAINPQNLQITLEPLATINLPVQLSLRGEPAVGYEAGTPKILPAEAIISGPESQIKQVTHAQVDLSIAGVRQDIQTTLPLRILDAEGNPVTGLTTNPESIQLSLPVTQQGGYRDIAVKVNVRGQQAGGYRVTNISVFPPVLTVYSKNPAIVKDLPGYVETEPLNLNGESQNVDTHLNLVLPPGVTIVGEQTVQVQVGIAAIEGSLSLTGIPVEVIGLGPLMGAHISPGQVDVIVTGPLPLLDKLTPGDIKFVVDLTGLTPGTHQATPQAEILITDIRVQSINPGTIEVIIIPGVLDTPTPSPTPSLTPTPTR